MKGLIVDYCGVLDGTDEEQRRWRAFFTAAKAEGVEIAILSNDPGGPGSEPIREWEYRGIVDAVCLSGEIGFAKPDRRAFEYAAETVHAPLNECVMVDDSITNIRAAVDNGLVGCYYQQFDRTVVELQGLFKLPGEF
ncbi:MAG: HAD family hydrolase [Corynebacterium sp.]|nr:HAD family hydrolase [Corynebacterium sp.]